MIKGMMVGVPHLVRIRIQGWILAMARLFLIAYACKQTTLIRKRTNHAFAVNGKGVVGRPIPHQTKEASVWMPLLFGGGWWIRTTEVSDNRFTVCPLWPLGKSPKCCKIWSWRTESNHQPADYKSAALPLSHASILSCNGDILSHKYEFVNSILKKI